jgi:hypothetical protein
VHNDPLNFFDPTGHIEQGDAGGGGGTWNREVPANWIINDMKAEWLINGQSGRAYWANEAEKIRVKMRTSKYHKFQEWEIMHSYDSYVPVEIPYTFLQDTLEFITPYAENSPGGGIETGAIKGLAAMGFIRTVSGFSDEAEDLFKQLKKDGAKFTRANTIGIVKTSSGKIAWLEKGNSEAGLLHIMLQHAGEFVQAGYKDGEKVSKLILDTISKKHPVGTYKDRLVYKIEGLTNLLAVLIGDNGFIVTSHIVSPNKVKYFE